MSQTQSFTLKYLSKFLKLQQPISILIVLLYYIIYLLHRHLLPKLLHGVEYVLARYCARVISVKLVENGLQLVSRHKISQIDRC